MNWQWWNSMAYLKSGVSWKKSFALCMVGSVWYYSFWVLQPRSEAQYICILTTTAMKKFSENAYEKPFASHNNMGPRITRITLENFRFKLVYYTHLPYSSDLAPSDFHLFRSLQSSPNNKKILSKNRWRHLWKIYYAQTQLNFTLEKSTS